jgi:hypothetical protein
MKALRSFETSETAYQSTRWNLAEEPNLEIFALLGFYAAQNGSLVPTFLDNLSVPSSRTAWPLKMVPISCTEMSIRNYYFTLRNIPNARRYHLDRGGSLKSLESLLQATLKNLKEILTVSMSGKNWKTLRHYSSRLDIHWNHDFNECAWYKLEELWKGKLIAYVVPLDRNYERSKVNSVPHCCVLVWPFGSILVTKETDCFRTTKYEY